MEAEPETPQLQTRVFVDEVMLAMGRVFSVARSPHGDDVISARRR